ALLHAGHARADRLDDARTLVAQDDRDGIGDRAVDDALVRVAQAGGTDRHPHLARAWITDGDVLDRDAAGRAVEDDALHDAFPIRSPRPGRPPTSSPFSTITSPFTMTRTTPSGFTCQRSSPPGMSATSCFFPSRMRVGSNIITSAW